MRSVADRTLICLIARARNDAFMTDGAPYIFNEVGRACGVLSKTGSH